MNNLISRCIRVSPAHWQDWYTIPLRMIIGFGFMQHGYAKLARGPEAFTAILHALGMPAPALISWATIRGPARSDLHGSRAERLQLNQADVGGRFGRPFRTTRL